MPISPAKQERASRRDGGSDPGESPGQISTGIRIPQSTSCGSGFEERGIKAEKNSRESSSNETHLQDWLRPGHRVEEKMREDEAYRTTFGERVALVGRNANVNRSRNVSGCKKNQEMFSSKMKSGLHRIWTRLKFQIAESLQVGSVLVLLLSYGMRCIGSGRRSRSR